MGFREARYLKGFSSYWELPTEKPVSRLLEFNFVSWRPEAKVLRVDVLALIVHLLQASGMRI